MEQSGIFDIKTAEEFLYHSIETFQFQYANNSVYRNFCDFLKVDKDRISSLEDIPFLPIEFFKSKNVVCNNTVPEIIFTSSGTTGSITSKHLVTDLTLYKKSYFKGYEYFYGDIKDYCVIALLPSYLERDGSSLIYMVQDLILKSGHPESGFFLNDYEALYATLNELQTKSTKTLIIGVSFALLEFSEKYKLNLTNSIVMETGGMKGRRKEMIREELHQQLTLGFGVAKIHSEYGMTELLSQAYSLGDGIFKSPPWMKILVRDTEDPLTYQKQEKTGGLNIIDLANRNSCSFIATQDLGNVKLDGSFEVLGRFDNSDIRGCNLMVL